MSFALRAAVLSSLHVRLNEVASHIIPQLRYMEVVER